MVRSEERFIVRTPLLPFAEAGQSSPDKLREIFRKPILREAIYLASPQFYQRLVLFLDNKLPAADVNRMCLSLNKYLLRLCSRSTPFGLFAAISSGSWSDKTSTRIEQLPRRHTRLDAECVLKVANELNRSLDSSNKILYFPNNTRYRVGNTWRYIDVRYERLRREYYLANVSHSSHLETILDRATKGCDKISLAECITDDEITSAEALEFVEEIIENRLLVSELDERLTGDDYYLHLRKVLAEHNVDVPVLPEIEKFLTSLDSNTPEANLETYTLLLNSLAEITGEKEFDHLVQTDCFRTSTINVNSNVASSIETTVDILSRLQTDSDGSQFDEFKRKFFEKYEYRTIDLSTALDPEVGIGYPATDAPALGESTLLESIEFHADEAPTYAELSQFQQFLIEKYSEALRNSTEVVLTEKELQPFMKDVALPSSLYALVSLNAAGDNEVDDGNFQINFSGAYGPSAVSLIARFCHLDQSLKDIVDESVRREEQLTGDSIFAEIVHANQPRTGNISTRPVLRDFEIPILTLSGVDEAHTILLSDLTLTMRENRMMLRSKKLDREVIPRLSSAHNYTYDTVAAYRFLCDLQYQDICASVIWDWGLLKTAPYLPQVRIGKVVVSPATWRLSDEEVEKLKNATDLVSVVNELRSALRLPDLVAVGEGDTEIPINLNDANNLVVLQKMLDTSNRLKEATTGKDLVVHDDDGGRYSNEFVVPLYNMAYKRDHTRISLPAGSVAREFALGSEWLYYKIYCNTAVADEILLEVVKPLYEELQMMGKIDGWFFIRYADPRHHIRLRFHGYGDFYGVVIDSLRRRLEPFLELGMISSVATDTYKREIERYGEDGIIASEEFFRIDSESALSMLTAPGNRDNVCFEAALLSIDQLFSAFQFPTQQRNSIVSEIRDYYFIEMKVDSAVKRSLADARRTNRKAVETILTSTALLEPFGSAMARRGMHLENISKSLLKLGNQGRLSIPALMKSYIHMSVNRLFQSNPRHHEMLICDYLSQFYTTQMARATTSGRTPY